MGSSYLLAHGLGKPCASAKAIIEFPPGRYRVWVRTEDSVAETRMGRFGQFRVLVDGQPLDEPFGTKGDGGIGSARRARPANPRTASERRVAGPDGLHLAYGRDLLHDDPSHPPPPQAGDEMRRWREQLLGLPQPPPAAGEFDVVVVGGGIAGCSAAVTAARLGCRVALVQNRPVLGGNNSPEIGVHTGPWEFRGNSSRPNWPGTMDTDPQIQVGGAGRSGCRGQTPGGCRSGRRSSSSWAGTCSAPKSRTTAS